MTLQTLSTNWPPYASWEYSGQSRLVAYLLSERFQLVSRFGLHTRGCFLTILRCLQNGGPQFRKIARSLVCDVWHCECNKTIEAIEGLSQFSTFGGHDAF
jgi:hypothetical protein